MAAVFNTNMSAAAEHIPTPELDDSAASSESDEESVDSEDSTSSEYDVSRDPYDTLLATVPRETLLKVLRNFAAGPKERGEALRIITGDLERRQAKLNGTSTTGQILGKRAKTQTCSGCDKSFDEIDNEIGSCKFYRWHPGHLEMNGDDDAWADTDFPEHVLPEDNPEGFDWDCCERNADGAGCEKYRHIVAADPPNKARKQ